jgi:hypothetical protein
VLRESDATRRRLIHEELRGYVENAGPAFARAILETRASLLG